METIVYVYPLRKVNDDGWSDVKEQPMPEKEWLSHKGKQVYSQNTKTVDDMYCMEELDMSDYHLVRVGITGELARMCGGSQQQRGAGMSRTDAERSEGESVQERGPKHSRKKREGFWHRRRRQKLQKMELQRQQKLLVEFLHQIQKEPMQSFFVCEESLPLFNRWEYNGYFEANWVKHMLRYAKADDQQGLVFPQVLVLGQTRCLPELLYQYAGKMKSLKWILPARQFREEQQELVEEIYDEYGLAVDVHLLEDEDAYRRTRICCALPTVVLDFSEADRVPTADIARGSLWLDMASSEEKRRRIEERNTGIYYFSLKKEWKQPQKALFHLDTTSKNGYNT